MQKFKQYRNCEEFKSSSYDSPGFKLMKKHGRVHTGLLHLPHPPLQSHPPQLHQRHSPSSSDCYYTVYVLPDNAITDKVYTTVEFLYKTIHI